VDGASTSDGPGDPPDPQPDPQTHPRSEEPADQPAANASVRQLSLNVVSSYASFGIGIVLSLVLTRVLLRHLGAGTYGLWIVLLALVGYLGLLDIGVGTAAVQRVARLTAIGDKEGVADLIRTTWVFFAASGILAIAVTVGLAPFVSSFLNLGAISPTEAGVTLVILGLMSTLLFLSVVPNSVLFGSGRGDRLSQIGLLVLLLTQGGQIIAVLAGAGLIALAVLQTAGIAIGLVLAASLAGRVTGSSLRRGHFSRPLLKELLAFGGLQSIISLGGVVSYQLDALIIGLILPVAQVAPYSVALNTSNFTRSLSTQGSALLLPTYSHFDAVADRKRQSRYFMNGVMACLVLAVPMVVSLAAFGAPILRLWLGSVPPKTYEIMIALGIVNVLQLPGHQCFLFLTGVGRNRQLVRLAVIGAVVNLAGTIGATYWLGPIGPAIGSIPVVLVLDFTVLPIMVCHYIEVPVGQYVRRALGPVLPVGLAAGAVALALVQFHPAHSGLAAIVASIVTCGVAWAVFLLLLAKLEPELRAALWQRLRRRRA
jgi:O-antigen/teichoic acid export membrane protein